MCRALDFWIASVTSRGVVCWLFIRAETPPVIRCGQRFVSWIPAMEWISLTSSVPRTSMRLILQQRPVVVPLPVVAPDHTYWMSLRLCQSLVSTAHIADTMKWQPQLQMQSLLLLREALFCTLDIVFVGSQEAQTKSGIIHLLQWRCLSYLEGLLIIGRNRVDFDFYCCEQFVQSLSRLLVDSWHSWIKIWPHPLINRPIPLQVLSSKVLILATLLYPTPRWTKPNTVCKVFSFAFFLACQVCRR